MSPIRNSARPRIRKTASTVNQSAAARKAGNAKKATGGAKKPANAPLLDSGVTNADPAAAADAEIAALKGDWRRQQWNQCIY